jgi:hypothetical protein
MKFWIFLLGLAVALASRSALAWDGFGHIVVAAIAYEKLTPKAREKAAELLKLNPIYDKWVAGVADREKHRTAFVLAATWPDAIKSKSAGFQDDGERASNPPRDTRTPHQLVPTRAPLSWMTTTRKQRGVTL